MWQYVVKVFITVVVIVAVAELGQRSSFWGALLASLPLTSLLAFIWLYIGTGSTQSVAALSQSIFMAGVGFTSTVPGSAVSSSLRCRVLA